MPACLAGVGAHGEDSGRDQVGGRGDEFHLVCLGQVGGFGGSFLGLVPPPRVDVRPPKRGQAGPLVPCVPGARIRCMASCSKVIARSDSSRSHAAEPIRHKAGSSREERLIWRRDAMISALLPNGSMHARIQSRCGRHRRAGRAVRRGAPDLPGPRERALQPGSWRARLSGRRRWLHPPGRSRPGPAGHARLLRQRRGAPGARLRAALSRPAPIRRRGGRSAAVPGPR